MEPFPESVPVYGGSVLSCYGSKHLLGLLIFCEPLTLIKESS